MYLASSVGQTFTFILGEMSVLSVWDTVGPGWLDFKGGVRAEAGRAVLLSTFLFKKWAYVTGYGNIFLWLFLSWKLSVIN